MARKWIRNDKGVMVNAERIPDFVFPDTNTGHEEAARLFDNEFVPVGVGISFCTRWIPDTDPRYCKQRRVQRDDGFNPCRKCPAGFLHDELLGLIPEGELSYEQ